MICFMLICFKLSEILLLILGWMVMLYGVFVIRFVKNVLIVILLVLILYFFGLNKEVGCLFIGILLSKLDMFFGIDFSEFFVVVGEFWLVCLCVICLVSCFFSDCFIIDGGVEDWYFISKVMIVM